MNDKIILQILFNNIKKYKKNFLYFILLDIISTILLIIRINYISSLIYFSIKNKIYFNKILIYFIKLFLLLFLNFFLNKLSNKEKFIFSNKIKNNIKKNINKKIKNNIINNDIDNIGKKVNIIFEYIENIQNFYYKYIPQYYLSILIPLIILINIFFYNKISFFILFFIFFITIFFIYIIGSYISDYNKKYLYLTSKFSGFFLDKLYGIEILKLFNCYKIEYKKIYNISNDIRIKIINILKISFLISNVIDIFFSISISFILINNFLTYILYFSNNIKLYDLEINGINTILLLFEFFYPIINLGKMYHIKIKTINSSYVIYNLFKKNKKININNLNINKIKINKKIFLIKAKNLLIKDFNNNLIIGPISFKIKKNDKIILFGSSGSGKTTFIKTLLGFNNYYGSLKYNNIELKKIDLKSIRKQIGWINDELNFPYNNIINNITLNNYIDIQKIYNLINIIDKKKFIYSLPNNIYNYIGENAKLLSVGQAQLLSMLRLFIKNNNILFLDEPTSNLDLNNSLIINKYIKKNINNKTILISSHKLINNINFNKKWILKNKKIIFN